MHAPFRLSEELHVVQFLSTRGISAEELSAIEKEARAFFKEDSKQIPYVGFCFGRYDLVIESSGNSGDILIRKCLDLQSHLNAIFRRDYGRKDVISSSMMLCRQMINPNENRSFNEKSAVKAYCFFKPQIPTDSEVEWKTDLQQVPKGCRLFWNPGLYNILLSVQGNSLKSVSEGILSFLDNNKKNLKRSATMITVNLDEHKSEEQLGNVFGLTFVKLKEFQKESVTLTKNRSSLLGDLGACATIFGWYDQCVPQEAQALQEMMNNIFALRKNYPTIDYTTTLILIPGDPKT